MLTPVSFKVGTAPIDTRIPVCAFLFCIHIMYRILENKGEENDLYGIYT
jgi:hypothetical protein